MLPLQKELNIWESILEKYKWNFESGASIWNKPKAGSGGGEEWSKENKNFEDRMKIYMQKVCLSWKTLVQNLGKRLSSQKLGEGSLQKKETH